MLRVKRGNLEPRYFAVNGMDSQGLIYKHLKIDDMRGNWTTIIFHTKMSKDPNKGFIKMYVNDILYNDYKGRTGIDASSKNISVAKLHAKKNKLRINYICQSPEKLRIKKKFDVILNMEIVEHVEDISKFINQSNKFLKNNGIMFIATLNQTLKSYVFAIIGAEYILRWLPIGTHDWNKFVKPENLENICNKNSLVLKRIDGVKFNPLLKKWSLSSDKSINYITKYKKG